MEKTTKCCLITSELFAPLREDEPQSLDKNRERRVMVSSVTNKFIGLRDPIRQLNFVVNDVSLFRVKIGSASGEL